MSWRTTLLAFSALAIVCFVAWWIYLKPPLVWGAVMNRCAVVTSRSWRNIFYGRSEYRAAFDQPIDIYGLVVDQSHSPVAGARILLLPNDNPHMTDASDGSGDGSSYETTSDAQGRFAVTGMRGITLFVKVQKAGYYTDNNETTGFFSPTGDSITQRLPKGTNDAAVFVIRKKDQPAELIRQEIRAKTGGKGKPVLVSLRTGKVGGDGKDDLQIEMTIDSEVSEPYKFYDWRCRISVPGGGLQSYQDDFSFTAPTDGYKPDDILEKTRNMPRNAANIDSEKSWSNGARRLYFVRTAAGNYARLRIEFDARSPGSIRIEESYLNPTGSINLESGTHNRYGW